MSTREALNPEEDGTENYPFKTIGAALEHIEDKDLDNKNVFVKKGIYNESVELTEGTNLIGEDRHETMINGEGRNNGIYFHSTESRSGI